MIDLGPVCKYVWDARSDACHLWFYVVMASFRDRLRMASLDVALACTGLGVGVLL